VLIASVGLLPSAFADAELFSHRQLISHGEHFVSIMKTLSSAVVFCPHSTQSAFTIITRDSGV